MKIHNVEQGKKEWLAIRKQVYTASALGVWITQYPKAWKAAQVKAREDAIIAKVEERLFGESKSVFKSDAMERGNRLEPDARAKYVEMTGNKVEEVGFCESDLGIFGCSPDGFIKDRKGMLEIKCPMLKGFLKNREDEDAGPSSYRAQIQMQMAVTGADYVEFFQYYPSLHPIHALIKRSETTEIVLANLIKLSEDTLELEDKLKKEMA